MLRGGERAIVRVKIPMRKVEEEEEVFVTKMKMVAIFNF